MYDSKISSTVNSVISLLSLPLSGSDEMIPAIFASDSPTKENRTKISYYIK
jgi:hypothetical protein